MGSGHSDVDDPFQTELQGLTLVPCKNTQACPPDAGLQGINSTNTCQAAGMLVPPLTHHRGIRLSVALALPAGASKPTGEQKEHFLFVWKQTSTRSSS